MVEKLKDAADEEVKKIESKYKQESLESSDSSITTESTKEIVSDKDESNQMEVTNDETSNDNEATISAAMTAVATTSTAASSSMRDLLRERLLRQLNGRVSGLFEGTYRSSHDYAILILYKSTKLLELMGEQKVCNIYSIQSN
jgi:hypothetical protein